MNKNTFPWFTNKTSLYLKAKNGDSPYYLNGNWDSPAVAAHLSDKTILPGESFKIKFTMLSGLIPTTENKETFELIFGTDLLVAGSEFEVSFESTKGDLRVIEITDTGSDWINVRECPSRECEKIDSINVGDKAIVLEEQDSWFKVKYAGGGEGWIVNSYYKEVK